MPRFARKTYRRRRVAARRPVRRPRTRRSRYGGRSHPGRLTNPGGFITRFNPMRTASIRTVRTDYVANLIQGSGSPGVSVAALNCYDPSGTASAPGSYVTLGAFPDWNNYAALYTYYKVNKIMVTFTYVSLQTTDGAILPEVFFRYCYNVDQAAPAAASLEAYPNWMKVNFVAEHRTARYTFYPRVIQDVVGTGKRPVRPGWIDVTNPAILLGTMMYIPALAGGDDIRADVTFDISFKGQV